MKKPVICITPSHNTGTDDLSLRPTYVRAVSSAGGLPVVMTLEAESEDLDQLVSLCDGFLFSGGPDPHPFLFGEETQLHCGNVSVTRDRLELALLKKAMAARKPILGICRGIQLINVALGGDIYQDISSQTSSRFPIAHQQPFAYTVPSHHAKVTKDSLLSAVIGGQQELEVNSMHHQACRQAAPCLTASAYAPDGLIEALEMPDYPYLLGVQWHPEYLWQTDKGAANIFKSFIEACKS